MLFVLESLSNEAVSMCLSTYGIHFRTLAALLSFSIVEGFIFTATTEQSDSCSLPTYIVGSCGLLLALEACR